MRTAVAVEVAELPVQDHMDLASTAEVAGQLRMDWKVVAERRRTSLVEAVRRLVGLQHEAPVVLIGTLEPVHICLK